MNEKKKEIYRIQEEQSLIKKYQEAIENVEEILHKIDRDLSETQNRMVVSAIKHRIKTAESVFEKLRRKQYEISQEGIKKLNDIVGVRIVCLFVDDIYKIRDAFLKRSDIKLVKEKDFVKGPKSTGYQSLHLILDVPVSTEYIRVELQIRTVAMDFWSVLEYQLQYKKQKETVALIEAELKQYANEINELDKKMLCIRKRIES